jgi:hypothetical protein
MKKFINLLFCIHAALAFPFQFSSQNNLPNSNTREELQSRISGTCIYSQDEDGTTTLVCF